MADDTLRPAVEADLESLLVLNNAAVPAVNALDAAEMAWFAEVAHLFWWLTPLRDLSGF